MSIDIIKWNTGHNTPSELMLAVKALTPGQKESLALSLVWKMVEKKNAKKKLEAKSAILRAKTRPI